MDHDAATLDRRTLLRAGAGATAATVGGAAATGTGAAQQTQEITVGPEGDMTTFDPSDVTVAPGTTVTFTWGTDGHNVVPQSQPDGANWEGNPEIVGSGSTHEHTFETVGTYEYLCEPHAPGMSGSIEVAEGGGGGGGGGATGPPEVPASAMNLVTGIIGALLSVAALAFYFIKYGGTNEE